MRSTQVRWRLGHRPALDGLRGLAVLIVIADHTGFLREPAGGIGVTIFFVLSGFLITRVVVESHESGTWSMPGFVANRLVRLFPALLLMVAVVSAIMLARGFTPGQVAHHALPALTYTENISPISRFPVFGHTWSLGVEEQFYLVWPLVLLVVLRGRRALAVVTLVIVASVAWEVASPRDWLPNHAYALLAGCALALAAPLVSRWWVLPLGVVGLVVSIAVAPHFSEIYVYGPMVAAPAAALMVVGAAGGSSVLELPLLRFTGRISYALYLWHVPLLRLTGTTYGRISAIPSILIAIILALLSTLLVEEPLRRAWRVRNRQLVTIS